MSRLLMDTTRALKRLSSHGLALGASLSCLPTNDLSSYSRGGSEITSTGALDTEGPLADDDVVGASDAAAVAEPAASGDEDSCREGCVPPHLALGLDAGTSAVSPGSQDAVAPVSGDAGLNETERDAGVCGPGALLGPDERCFALVTALSPWSEARLSCQERGNGWDLTTIRDPERNAWLAEILGGLLDAWVGASDLEDEGDWYWVGDAQPFWLGPGDAGASVDAAYENWNQGENPEPNGSAGSNCLRLRDNGGWADISCDEVFPSLCEGPRP
jgi:hypothetical protein